MPESKSSHTKHQRREKDKDGEKDDRGRIHDRKGHHNGSGKKRGSSTNPDRPTDPNPPGRPPPQPKKDEKSIGSSDDVETYQNIDSYSVDSSANQDGQSYSFPVDERIEVLINSQRFSAVVDRNVEESFISSKPPKKWKLKPKLASKSRSYRGLSAQERVKVPVELPTGILLKECTLYVLHSFEGVVIGRELATKLNPPANPSTYNSSNDTSTQSYDTGVAESLSGQMNDLSFYTSNSNNQRNLGYDDERQPQESTSKYSDYPDQYIPGPQAPLTDSAIGMDSNKYGGSVIPFSSYGSQNAYPPPASYTSHTPSSPPPPYTQTDFTRQTSHSSHPFVSI